MRRITCDNCNRLIPSPSQAYAVMGYGKVHMLYCKKCYVKAHKEYGGESFGASPSASRKLAVKHLLAEGEWTRREILIANLQSLVLSLLKLNPDDD